MSAEGNKEIVRRYFDEALNQKNFALLDEVVSDESLKQLVTSTLGRAFPDLQRTVEDVVAEGDKVVARLTMRGTHTGEYLGVPPTGRKVTFTAIGIYRIENGKIAEAWISRDDLTILRQIGGAPDS